MCQKANEVVCLICHLAQAASIKNTIIAVELYYTLLKGIYGKSGNNL